MSSISTTINVVRTETHSSPGGNQFIPPSYSGVSIYFNALVQQTQPAAPTVHWAKTIVHQQIPEISGRFDQAIVDPLGRDVNKPTEKGLAEYERRLMNLRHDRDASNEKAAKALVHSVLITERICKLLHTAKLYAEDLHVDREAKAQEHELNRQHQARMAAVRAEVQPRRSRARAAITGASTVRSQSVGGRILPEMDNLRLQQVEVEAEEDGQDTKDELERGLAVYNAQLAPYSGTAVMNRSYESEAEYEAGQPPQFTQFVAPAQFMAPAPVTPDRPTRPPVPVTAPAASRPSAPVTPPTPAAARPSGPTTPRTPSAALYSVPPVHTFTPPSNPSPVSPANPSHAGHVHQQIEGKEQKEMKTQCVPLPIAARAPKPVGKVVKMSDFVPK